MGFLGTAQGAAKLFGRTISRYTGMMVRGILNAPALSELLAFYDGNDGETLHDTIVPANIVPEPDVVEVSCLESSGAQTMSHASITNGAVIVNAGTAVGTATAGVITFTAGTISQVQIDGVMTYPCEELSGFPQDVSGNGNHITSMTVTRTTSDLIGSWNLDKGFVPATVSDGVSQYINTGIPTSENLTYKITLSDWSGVGISGGAVDTNNRMYIQALSSTSLKAVIGGSANTVVMAGMSGVNTIEMCPNGDVFLNGALEGNTGGTVVGTDVDNTFIFAQESGGSAINRLAASIYEVDLIVSGTSAKTFIPFGDGQMLDIVNSVLYSNAGTGSLVTKRIPAIEGDAFDKVKGSIYAEVNPLLIGKTLAVEGQLYSASVPGVSYTRNAAFWGAGYDTSCISVHNSVSATTRRLTLVTQRHAVGATHYGGYAIGQTYGFLDMSNNYYERTIEAFSEIAGEDISVFQFDSDLPASVVPCKVLPANWDSYLDLGASSTHVYPTLATNQYDEGTIQELYLVSPTYVANFQTPTRAEWLSMYKLPVAGDSGNPTLLMQNGNTFLVTLWWGTASGTLYANHIDEINAEISGFGSSYTLEEGTLTATDIAANGLALTNPAGKVSNNSEVSFEMTDPAYLDTVTLLVGGVESSLVYAGLINSKPWWDVGGVPFTQWNGANWVITTLVGTSTHPTATGFFPPLTGWPDASGQPVSTDYNRFFIDTSNNDDCKFTRRDHADYLAWPNLSGGEIIQWEKYLDLVCVANKYAVYPQAIVFTESQYNQGVRWAGNPSCGVGPIPF